MDDGGMGSLYFVRLDKARGRRRFGAQIAQTEFTDDGGTVVSVSLNDDQDGELFELDAWRTDFSPAPDRSR